MSVSGIVVVIVEVQGLPATVMLFKVNVLLHIYHRWRVSKSLMDGVCATVAISLPLH